MTIEPNEIVWAMFAILLGGFLKGVTGAGTPVVGVPVLTSLFGIQFAVAIFSVLNLLSNIWQAFAYRDQRTNWRLVAQFAISGALGAMIGSVLLAWLPAEALMAFLALVILAYILLRLSRPSWQLARKAGERLAVVAGLSGGVMQGAGGISAPISVTYLNAMRLTRGEFISTISVFFCAMSVLQIPALAALGILTWERVWISVAAAAPLFLAIWAGERAAKHLSKAWFDRVILMLLIAIAVRLIWVAAEGSP